MRKRHRPNRVVEQARRSRTRPEFMSRELSPELRQAFDAIRYKNSSRECPPQPENDMGKV